MPPGRGSGAGGGPAETDWQRRDFDFAERFSVDAGLFPNLRPGRRWVTHTHTLATASRYLPVVPRKPGFPLVGEGGKEGRAADGGGGCRVEHGGEVAVARPIAHRQNWVERWNSAQPIGR